MPMKAIYLNDELYSKLKQERNASGLIASLLEEHFKQTEGIGLTEEELKLEIAKEEILTEAKEKIDKLTQNGENRNTKEAA